MIEIHYPDSHEILDLLNRRVLDNVGQFETKQEVTDNIILHKLRELNYTEGVFYIQYSFCGGRKKNVFWIAKKKV